MTATLPCRSETVFIVDDDTSFLQSVSRLLRAVGYSVQAFASASEFLARLAPGMSGCVVTDLQMPGMNGLELQAALRRSANPLPVIFLTGQGDIPATQRWLRIIPVALLIMYTISYVDRTNVSLALDPKISIHDARPAHGRPDEGAGGGHFFSRLRSAANGRRPSGQPLEREKTGQPVPGFLGRVRRGLRFGQNLLHQFEVTRFFLGVAESCVFPATAGFAGALVSQRRTRAGQCAIGICASRSPWWPPHPFTGWLLGAYGWQTMLILEGALPFLWLPIWWFFISDHPRDAKWISAGGTGLSGNHAGTRSGASWSR
jgi:CheY-like chemotaxis protein